MNTKWSRTLALCTLLASACGGGGGTASRNATAVELIPELCAGDSNAWTDLVLYVGPAMNSCNEVGGSLCPPPPGEEVLKLILFKSASSGPLTRIGVGTYSVPDAVSAERFSTPDDTTSTCGGRDATAGSVTITSVSGGYAGTYDLVVAGAHVTRTFDAQLC